jgi:glycosyltransferase involved in cell wall biosynthesis
MADQLGLGQRARFLGPRPPAHLGSYLAQADILASPRLQGNNTPMKIYSYLDSGKPLLATRLATHTQVLNDRVAMLVEPTPAGLAEGLVRLASDADLRQRLGSEGRRLIQRRHSLAGYRRKLLGFYAAMQRSLKSKEGRA